MSISFRTRRRLSSVLEKLAASEALIANLVGAEGKAGRVSARVAKRMARSAEGQFNQETFRQARGPKGGKSSVTLLSKDDEAIRAVRKQKGELQKQIRQMEQELSNLGSAPTKDQLQQIAEQRNSLKELSKQETQLSQNKYKEYRESSGDTRADLDTRIQQQRENAKQEKARSLKGEQARFSRAAGNVSQEDMQRMIDRGQVSSMTDAHQAIMGKANEQIRRRASRMVQRGVPENEAIGEVLNRAHLEAERANQLNRGVSVSQASTGLSSGERAYIDNASKAKNQVSSQYQKMINDKKFIESANVAIQDPKMANEYAAYIQRFGNVSPQEFMARKNLQVQMRQAGNVEGRNVLFNAPPEGVNPRTQMFQTSPTEGRFFQTNTAATNQGALRQQAVTQNHINETMKAMSDAEQASYVRHLNNNGGVLSSDGYVIHQGNAQTFDQFRINRGINDANRRSAVEMNQKVQDLISANPSLTQEGARAQAIASMPSGQQQPLTNLQSYQLKNTGGFQPIQGQNVQSPQQVNFQTNPQTQAPQLDFSKVNKQTKQAVNTARNQELTQNATNQAKSTSDKEGGPGFFQGTGGYLLAGAGLLGAGYLYANSSNTPQPQPNQNGY